jgi:hypothetical protein
MPCPSYSPPLTLCKIEDLTYPPCRTESLIMVSDTSGKKSGAQEVVSYEYGSGCKGEPVSKVVARLRNERGKQWVACRDSGEQSSQGTSSWAKGVNKTASRIWTWGWSEL